MIEPFDKRFSRLLAEKFVERLRTDRGFIDMVRDYFSVNHHEQPQHLVKFWMNLTSDPIDVLCSRIMAPTDEGGFARETLPPLLNLTNKERAEMIASARAAT
jgi:hypothetical protein